MEWLLEQIVRLTNFLSSASEDIEDFTVNVQNRIEKYRNKQCGKACIFGIVVGAVALLVLQAVFS